MATVNDWTTVSYGGNYNIPATGINAPAVKKRHVDTSVNAQASGEYYRLLKVAANSMVRVTMVTKTVEGAADTADVSFVATTDTTAASPVSIISNHDVNVDDTCNTGTIIFTDVAGDICVKPDAALGTCVYGLVAEVITLATTD